MKPLKAIKGKLAIFICATFHTAKHVVISKGYFNEVMACKKCKRNWIRQKES